MGSDLEPFFAPPDRGLEEVRQGAASEARGAGVEGPEGHRGGDRLVADLVDRAFEEEAEAVLRLAAHETGPHVGSDRERGPAVEVEQPVHLPPGQVDVHRAEAGHPAHEGVDGGLDERARERRIDRVPAAVQNVRPGLDRLRLRGGDDALHGVLSSSSGSPRSQ